VHDVARANQARKQRTLNCRDETDRDIKGGGRESADGRQLTTTGNTSLRMNKWQIRDDSTPTGSTFIRRMPIPHDFTIPDNSGIGNIFLPR
jgi:hypothetical protein